MICDARETIRFLSHAILGSTHSSTPRCRGGRLRGAGVAAFADTCPA